VDKGKNAVEHFLGQKGKKRLNCAQAFATVFLGEYGIDQDLVKNLKKHGVGRAPGGHCGIYYFADQLLQRAGKEEQRKDFQQFFKKFANTLTCKELRHHKIPFCARCLKDSVDYIQEIL
jgi:hypothetical protein